MNELGSTTLIHLPQLLISTAPGPPVSNLDRPDKKSGNGFKQNRVEIRLNFSFIFIQKKVSY